MVIFTFLFLFSLFISVEMKCFDTFPKDFKWGIATSAYQVEGAWNIDGKSEHIWDRFTHEGKAYHNDTGDVAGNSYHHLKEDVQLVKNLNVDFYRFSISWSRIIPYPMSNNAKVVNQAGLDYYDRLINELLSKGVQPFVTIYHWDLPQSLQEELPGGWNNTDIVEHYVQYADVLFEKFGDRVKHWLTFNEPWVICWMGYGSAEYAPGIREPYFTPYQCGHNILRAHAETYRLYQQKYAKQQKGKVGITLNTDNMHPKNPTDPTHVAAAQRLQQLMLGWFANPIFGSGDYPEVMKQYIQNKSLSAGLPPRLPSFSLEEKRKLKGSADFLGLNHYTTSLVEPFITDTPGYPGDVDTKISHNSTWQTSGSSWLYVTPWGFREILNWIKKEYNNVEIYVTENGITDNNGTLNDQFRIYYYKEYIHNLLQVIQEDGCNVSGYIAWCLLDTFEWSSGYHEKFGLYHIDFQSPNRTRTPKQSAKYYTNIVKDNGFKSDHSKSCPANSGSIHLWHVYSGILFLYYKILV